MKKTAAILMLLTIVSKVFGFGRDIILSYFYGASNISDAYLISQTIPTVIFSFIGVGISTGYIPMYSKIEKSYGEHESNTYTNNLINVLLVLCTIIVIVSLLFTNEIVTVFASGFTGETLALAVKFTRISIVGIYFTAIVYVAQPFLQIKGNYIIPALMGLPLNLTIILSIFLSSKIDITILAIGSVVAIISQLLILIPSMYKAGYRYKLILNLKDKFVKSMIAIAIPVILGTSVNQVNTLVDRTLASTLAVGGISALNYANKLNLFIQGIFVMSIATVFYPTISKMMADGNIDGLKKSVSESVISISLLVIPSTIGSMVFATPVVSLLFSRGAFDLRAMNMTSDALFFYSVGMIGFGLREILSRVFYSMQDTKTPMINAVIGFIMNVILNLILSKFIGIGGLALATSISAIFTTILLFISLPKKIGSFGIKQIIISLIKILFASLIMGLIAKISFNLLTDNILSQNISLVISVGIGAIAYFVIIYFMKIKEVDIIVGTVRRKIIKGRA